MVHSAWTGGQATLDRRKMKLIPRESIIDSKRTIVGIAYSIIWRREYEISMILQSVLDFLCRKLR